MHFFKLLTIAALSTMANVEAQQKPSIRGRAATAGAHPAGGGAPGLDSFDKFEDQRKGYEAKMLAKEEDNVRLTAKNNLLKAEILALKAKVEAFESRSMTKEDFVGVNGVTASGTGSWWYNSPTSCPASPSDRCTGIDACKGICGDFYVGQGSCTEEESCISSSAIIASDSCTGYKSCKESRGSIRGGACTGYESCFRSLGTIGIGACTRNYTCSQSQGFIESGSCTGQNSCFGSGGTVGNYACTADEGCYELPPDVVVPDNCASKADKDEDKCNNWYNQRYNTENRTHGCVIAEGKVASPESYPNPKQCALACKDGCFGIQYNLNIDGGTCSMITSSIDSSDLGECECCGVNDDVLVYLKNPPPVSVEALE